MSQPIFDVEACTFDQAIGELAQNDTPNFLRHLASIEVFDYTPLEEAIRRLTWMARICFAEPPLTSTGQIDPIKYADLRNWAQRVQVAPRGSFASRTAVIGFADLDLDLIFPDDYMVPIPGSTDFAELKLVLGMDEDFENILFKPDSLKVVLGYIWHRLSVEYRVEMYNQAPLKQQFPLWWREDWIVLRRTVNDFTRSIDAKATAKQFLINKDGAPLEIDLFLKLRTKIQGQEAVRGQEMIVGVDKDAPDGTRRLQTTKFMPIEGQWLGDQILGPVDRSALLMLKWWKIDQQKKIKSHHLLAALNALHKLDRKDPLFIPQKTSGSFSLLRVMDVMIRILLYINNAYTTPCTFLTTRPENGQLVTDYPFPQFSRGIADTLFMQFIQEVKWDGYQAFLKKNFVLDFAKQLQMDRDALAKRLASSSM